MEKIILQKEIENLRQKLYQALINSDPNKDILYISQQLDILILEWMEYQKKESAEKRACNL